MPHTAFGGLTLPTLGLLVPQEMRETYRHPRKPKEDHLEIASTYTNYRRVPVDLTKLK